MLLFLSLITVDVTVCALVCRTRCYLYLRLQSLSPSARIPEPGTVGKSPQGVTTILKAHS